MPPPIPPSPPTISTEEPQPDTVAIDTMTAAASDGRNHDSFEAGEREGNRLSQGAANPLARSTHHLAGRHLIAGTGAALPLESLSAVAESPPTDLSGRKIGEYEIISRIGVGGMGEVYEGRQPLIGKRVAVKVLLPTLSNEKELVERFLAEARAVNEIRHRGIVDIFSFGQLPSGSHYFVMEYLEGQAFDRLLKDRGALPIAEALSYVEEVLDALEAAHSAGIVHRDIKPSNIFLVNTGRGKPYVKLLDFGIAKLGARANGSDSQPQTRASVILGTPDYISPEQARGKPISAATDLYALGAVLFEMVTGFRPFRGENTLQTMWMHVEDAPPVPSTIRAEIPQALDELILWALEKESENRPKSAEEMRAHLEAVRASLLPGSGSTTPAPITGRNPTLNPATPSGRQRPLSGTPPPRSNAGKNSGSLVPIDVTAPRPAYKPPAGAVETRLQPSLTANPFDAPDRTRVEVVRPDLTTTDPERQSVARPPEGADEGDELKAPTSRGPMLAVVGIASIVLIGVGGWVLFGSDPTTKVPDKPIVESPKPPKPEVLGDRLPDPKPDPVANVDPQPNDPKPDPVANVDPRSNDPKPDPVANVDPKPKDPKPVATLEPKPKDPKPDPIKSPDPKPVAKGVTQQTLEARLAKLEAKLAKREADMGEPDRMLRKFLGEVQSEVNAAKDDASRKAALKSIDELDRQLR